MHETIDRWCTHLIFFLSLIMIMECLRISNSLYYVMFLLLILGSLGAGANKAHGEGEGGGGAIIRNKRGVSSSSSSSSSSAFDPTRVTQLSWHPRAFLYKRFLSDEESDHLIFLAKDKLKRSLVADNESGKGILSKVRTSSDMFINEGDEIVSSIEERIAAWTFLPKENGESIQVLRYERGQKYEPHVDYFYDKVNLAYGGHRIATVLMYLSNVAKGGETVFPRLKLQENQSMDENWSECARRGYAVKPKKGDALLFFSLHVNTTTDRYSKHGSCPVIEGEKWSATKWIHVRSFETKQGKSKKTGGCIDENVNCPKWAASGECEKNPDYMVGSKDDYGYCRKSCKVC